MAEAAHLLLQLEADCFRALNRFVEPIARAGWCAPGLFPTGLIVLETKAARSERWRRTPVLATALGRYLLVGTVRGRRARWVARLARSANARYWRGGELWDARAIVFAPEKPSPDLDELPLPLAALGAYLTLLSQDLGCAFALLAPPA